MHGIIGYIGSRQAASTLLEGPEKLEYRGYDSADIIVYDGDREPVAVRTKGRLRVLADKTDNGHALKGCCGIGHTRWATHGVPSETNAHPHVPTDGSVLAVYNGISENYLEIREKFACHSYHFYSQTDTEVIVNLIDYYYKKYKMGPVDVIAKTLVRVRGSYALATMFRDYPEQVYITRKDNLLIVRLGEGENFTVSDPSACLKYTRRVCYIDNFEVGCVTKDSVIFYDLNGDVVEKTPALIDRDETAAERGGCKHFMMKETYEQPKAIADIFRAHLSDETDGRELDYRVDLAKLGLTDELIQSLSGVTIIDCGSAHHVGATTQYVIEDLAKLPARVEFASEYRHRHPVIDLNNLVAVVNQSGEIADMLAAMREVKERGLKTPAIVNVTSPVIAREADPVLYTYVGPEIPVTTTKAYSTQLIGVYLLAICLGKTRGLIDEREEQRLLAEIVVPPEKVQRIIDDRERPQWFAMKFSNAKDVFFIGCSIDYTICMGGGLKVKEISYIHPEVYVVGELKHGTTSLIEDSTLVIGVLTQSEFYEKTPSNLVEAKSRDAYLMGFTIPGNYDVGDTVNFAFLLPKTDEHFADSFAVVSLQLLGYYLAVLKGFGIDKSRNLVKSVTVEWA